ncbi:MAG TPA: FAD-binding protein [Pseudomonadales bacterium]|nr:FAD-binding protein [Pseudomonadales bacterium]
MSRVLKPDSEDEVAQIVAEAALDTTPIRIRGGGTRCPIGQQHDGLVIDTTALAGIGLYEPSEMIISARAGTPLSHVQQVLADHGQMLPFDPMDHRPLLGTKGTPTIGGVAAGNISGSRRVTAGGARDHMIGVRLLNGRGEAIKSGGRVMKNVTGLDLVKLNAGALGTLGVLTEITFKVLPVPETRLTLCVEGQAPEAALNLMAAAMATPYEVTSSAYIPKTGTRTSSLTLFRLEGFLKSCRYRFARLVEHLRLCAPALEIEGHEEELIWTRVRDCHDLAEAGNTHVLRVHTAPSRAGSIIKIATTNGIDFQIDWAGGLIWLGSGNGEKIEQVKSAIANAGGHPIHVRGDARKRLLPAHPAIQVLGARIKTAFDPAGILNPGVLEGHV